MTLEQAIIYLLKGTKYTIDLYGRVDLVLPVYDSIHSNSMLTCIDWRSKENRNRDYHMSVTERHKCILQTQMTEVRVHHDT